MRALGDCCVAVILHGSLASNAFEPGRSDADLLVAAAGALSDARFDALRAAVLELEQQAPVLVDVHVVTRDLVETPVRLPAVEAVFEIHPGRRPYVERRRAHDRDVVVELSVCRQDGVALFGPSPRALIGDVPDEWVIAVGREVIDDWIAIGDDPEHAAFTVLTTCRIWRFAEERRHCSKVEAARWALERDPSLQVVRQALERRSGGGAEVDPRLVAELLTRVRGHVGS